MSRKCLYYISAYTRECVKIKEITRQHVKATKLLRVPFFVTMHHVHNFRKAASHAKSAAAIDFSTRLQGLCEAASAAMDKGNLREFYAIKRTICLKQSSSLVSPHVDDKVLSCYSDIKQAFMSHFSSALAGTNVDPSQVFLQFSLPDNDVPLVEMPSESISDTAKSGNLLSGAGTDTLKYIVYKHFPHLLQALKPVFHYAACTSPPLQWYVHILQELFKNKGSPHLLKSYRDILLANTSGKHFCRSVRMDTVPFLDTYIIDSMCGGFLKRGTDFCSHYLRAMSSFARRSAL